jgi:xanthine/uracil/vitamin C permease (AzgA family)
MQPPGHHPSLLVSLLIGAFVVWRFYSRIRRMVIRQKLSKVRPLITVCAFPVLLALLAASSIAQPLSLAAVLGGTAIGAGLGIFGLRRTRFEKTPEGLYYTPSAHVGIALSVLLIGRLGYRAMQMYSFSDGDYAPPVAASGLANSPVTLLIFGALAGYYVAYAIGLLRWRQSVANAPDPVASSQPESQGPV